MVNWHLTVLRFLPLLPFSSIILQTPSQRRHILASWWLGVFLRLKSLDVSIRQLYKFWIKLIKKVKSLSRVQLFAIPWTIAYHAPLSMGFSKQKYWRGLPFPCPADLPDPGIEPRSPHCRQMLYHLSHQGSPLPRALTGLSQSKSGFILVEVTGLGVGARMTNGPRLPRTFLFQHWKSHIPRSGNKQDVPE